MKAALYYRFGPPEVVELSRTIRVRVGSMRASEKVTLGAAVLLLAARAAAHDYANGTIRVLIGGGAGRPTLLAAKIAAVSLIAIVGAVVAVAVAAGVVAAASPALTARILSLPPSIGTSLPLTWCRSASAWAPAFCSARRPRR